MKQKSTTAASLQSAAIFRKYLMLLSFAMTVLVSTAFAFEDIVVSKKVEDAFKKEFSGAQLLGWTEQDEFLKATFIHNGLRAEAYFTASGELAGSIRGVYMNVLPMAVSSALETRYGKFIIVDAFEIYNDEGTSYRVTIEAGSKRYRARVKATGELMSALKIKK